MYERFYGFRERPFELTPNPRCLVLTDGHREAINGIEYGIATRRGVTLLIGPAGSGKTTVIRAAAARQPAYVHCVHLNNLALTRSEFIEMLGAGFDLSDKARQSKTALLLELEALLRRRHQADEITALIVDEAQSLSLDLLEEIRLLANIETDEEKLLSVVLAGQPELATRLDDPAMSQLKQRIGLWCELKPLTMNETAAYMVSRIRSAGGVEAEVFTMQAVERFMRRRGHTAHHQRDRGQCAHRRICRPTASGEERDYRPGLPRHPDQAGAGRQRGLASRRATVHRCRRTGIIRRRRLVPAIVPRSQGCAQRTPVINFCESVPEIFFIVGAPPAIICRRRPRRCRSLGLQPVKLPSARLDGPARGLCDTTRAVDGCAA